MADTGTESTTITLRALQGEPLKDQRVRDMVVATAHAIAERHGIDVRRVSTTPQQITITLAAGRIEALGLAAELRRLTTEWYQHKYGEDHLWGDPKPVDESVHDDSNSEDHGKPEE